MKELIAHSALLRTTVRERKINTHTRFITQDVHLVEHLIHSVWTKPFFLWLHGTKIRFETSRKVPKTTRGVNYTPVSVEREFLQAVFISTLKMWRTLFNEIIDKTYLPKDIYASRPEIQIWTLMSEGHKRIITVNLFFSLPIPIIAH